MALPCTGESELVTNDMHTSQHHCSAAQLSALSNRRSAAKSPPPRHVFAPPRLPVGFRLRTHCRSHHPPNLPPQTPSTTHHRSPSAQATAAAAARYISTGARRLLLAPPVQLRTSLLQFSAAASACTDPHLLLRSHTQPPAVRLQPGGCLHPDGSAVPAAPQQSGCKHTQTGGKQQHSNRTRSAQHQEHVSTT